MHIQELDTRVEGIAENQDKCVYVAVRLLKQKVLIVKIQKLLFVKMFEPERSLVMSSMEAVKPFLGLPVVSVLVLVPV